LPARSRSGCGCGTSAPRDSSCSGLGGERDRPGADPARRDAGDHRDPGDDGGGAIAGGLWGFIPGILKARLGVSEIIVTLMLNYIALSWVQFWVFGPWSEGGFQQTDAFPREAWLPRLTDFATAVPGSAG
jgi:hypothetical protein